MSNSERNTATPLTLQARPLPQAEEPERLRKVERLHNKRRPRLRVISSASRTISRFRYSVGTTRAKHLGQGRALRSLQQHVASYVAAPPDSGIGQIADYHLAGMPALVPAHYAAQRVTGKRVLDIFGALALIVFFSPVLLLVAMMVRLTSRGPILFRQARLGLDGKHFSCWKFRTMVPDAEMLLRQSDALQKLHLAEYKIKDDPRITPIGKFLRRASLDELPQLFNVLDGTMSLVGPRPIVPKELEKYGSYGGKLLRVQPGITGVWQVCGRSDVTYEERVLMDMFYIDHGSLLMDIWLLLSTVTCVMRCRGAY